MEQTMPQNRQKSTRALSMKARSLTAAELAQLDNQPISLTECYRNRSNLPKTRSYPYQNGCAWMSIPKETAITLRYQQHRARSMDTGTNIFLIDGDVRRRAAISHCLAGSAIHVEPFEDCSELICRWPHSGILLAHDNGQTIRNLLTHMEQVGRWLPMIGFAEGPNTRMVVQAVIDGAIDYIAWPFNGDDIAQLINEAEPKAEVYGNLKQREGLAKSRLARLTRREREVLLGVATGRSNRVIGETLSISPRTVEIHRANMLAKMGANHTSEAIRVAIESGFVN